MNKIINKNLSNTGKLVALCLVILVTAAMALQQGNGSLAKMLSPTPTPTPQVGPPTSKEQCKDDGFKMFNTPRTFKNQGDCVSFVEKNQNQTPTPTPSPSPSVTPTATPTPTVTPSPSPTATPMPSPSPSPTVTPTPSPSPTPQVGPPTSKEQCMNGGFKSFNTPRTFKNQGECISFVQSNKSPRQ